MTVRHRWRVAAAAGLLAAAIATEAASGEAQDRLFAEGVLDGVVSGRELIFRHERSGGYPGERPAKIADGEIAVALTAGEEGRRAEVRLTGQDGSPAVAQLPAAAGHPLLLVFLENSARAMAELTGGNPVYIRNRMREALGAQDETEPAEIVVEGAAAPGTRITFRPFADDPNRNRMGAFADLELDFVVSDAVPGGFAELRAASGPGAGGEPDYLESMVFERIEGE